MDWLSWRCFRRTHTTLANEPGMAFTDRMAMMGHSEARMTRSTRQTTSPGDARFCINRQAVIALSVLFGSWEHYPKCLARTRIGLSRMDRMDGKWTKSPC